MDDMTLLLVQVVPFLAVIVVFYFVLIRPESKRKKELAKLRKEVDVGDEITTIGGIIAKVINVKDDVLTIEMLGGARMKIQRWAVSTVNADDPPQA